MFSSLMPFFWVGRNLFGISVNEKMPRPWLYILLPWMENMQFMTENFIKTQTRLMEHYAVGDLIFSIGPLDITVADSWLATILLKRKRGDIKLEHESR
jgi:hypothetical protein